MSFRRHRNLLLLLTNTAAAAAAAGARSFPHQLQQRATFVGDVKIRWFRDRGLDHAIEKEKHLLPFLSLKDHLLLTPSSSSILNYNNSRLSLHSFARRFPSAYSTNDLQQEDCPSSAATDIVICPTPDLLRLHEDELSLYSSLRDDTANRLLRLLMLSRTRSLPLDLLHRLRLDLGLPSDFPSSLLPHYPHYFHLHNTRRLDLVFWDRRLAVSTLANKNSPSSSAFPLRYPTGFVIDKKIAKWMEEWQRLPYLSPYDEHVVVDPKTPLGEKFAVGVLHELLHLFVSKKAARDELLLLAEFAGLRPAPCKKLLVNYPGIFYVSNKNYTYTVVLRESYKRDVLAVKHPLMEMRYRYIHLMHKPVEEAGASDRKNCSKSRKSVVADEGNAHNDCDDEEDYHHESYEEDEMEEEDDDEVDGEQQEGKLLGSSEFGSEKMSPLGREFSVARELQTTGATRGKSVRRTTRGTRKIAQSSRSSSSQRHPKTRKPSRRHHAADQWRQTISW